MDEEIKKYKIMTFRMFSAMRSVYNLLNERETDEILKNQLNKIEDIIECDDINDIIKSISLLKEENKLLKETVEILGKDLNFLMEKQRDREVRLSKFFTYDSTDSE